MDGTENGTSGQPSVGSGTGAAASSTPSSPATASAALSAAASSAAAAANPPAQGAPDANPDPNAGAGTNTAAISAGSAQGQQAASVAAPQGPIPFDRHEAAVRNARETARRELMEQYGISNQDAAFVQWALANGSRLRQNPQEFMRALAQEIGGGEQEEEITFPEPDLVSEDGRHHTYSRERLEQWGDAREKRLLRSLMGELQPLIDSHQRGQQEAQAQAYLGERRQLLMDTVNHARANYPHFKEHEKDIAEIVTSTPAETKQRFGLPAVIQMAYMHVLKEKILPTVGQAAEQQVREGYNKKAAAASGAVQPGAAASHTIAKPTNERELAGYMRQLEQRMAGAA